MHCCYCAANVNKERKLKKEILNFQQIRTFLTICEAGNTVWNSRDKLVITILSYYQKNHRRSFLCCYDNTWTKQFGKKYRCKLQTNKLANFHKNKKSGGGGWEQLWTPKFSKLPPPLDYNIYIKYHFTIIRCNFSEYFMVIRIILQ